jgi:hypothetical protein
MKARDDPQQEMLVMKDTSTVVRLHFAAAGC